jgi:hypothetical protein
MHAAHPGADLREPAQRREPPAGMIRGERCGSDARRINCKWRAAHFALLRAQRAKWKNSQIENFFHLFLLRF